MAEAYSSQSAPSFDGQGDINWWLLKMKFCCSTKRYAEKKEAHALASKLTGAELLVVVRMPEKDQDNPDENRKALKAEFDKPVLDRETAVQKLKSRVRAPMESPAQLAYDIARTAALAYPTLAKAKEEDAKAIFLQIQQDSFFNSLDKDMSIKLGENEHHREMELSKMVDEVTRLELAQQKSGKSVNAVKVSSGAKETEKFGSETTTGIRSIIREEIQSAVTQDRQDGDSLHNETWNKSVNFVGTSSGSNRKRGCGYRPRGRGRSRRDRRDNLKNAEPRCYHCNLPGHFRRQCQFTDCGQQCWEPGHQAKECMASAPKPLNC